MTHWVLTLDEGEQRVARGLGKLRAEANRTAGVVDQKRSASSGVEIDIDGIGAELAFAKLMNVYPDLGISPRQGSADAELAGVRIDVKTTRHPHGRLFAMPHKTGIDLWVLVVGVFPTYEIKGVYDTKRLFVAERLRNLGRGDNYVVEQSDLEPLTADDISWGFA